MSNLSFFLQFRTHSMFLLVFLFVQVFCHERTGDGVWRVPGKRDSAGPTIEPAA